MNSCIESLNQLSGIWFEVVTSVVVQSLCVVAVAMMAASMLRKCSGALRFWIWQAAALKLLIVPFSLIVVLPFWPSTPIQSVETSQYAAPPMDPVVRVSNYSLEEPTAPLPEPNALSRSVAVSASAYAFCGWMFIVAVQVVRCLQRWRLLSGFLKTCIPASDDDQLRFQQLAEKLNVSRPLRLVRGAVQVPLVTGVRLPTIILPADRDFDSNSFDQMVLHELAHVKRGDLVWVWLPEVLRMLFFFYPPAYWVQRQAMLMSEIACDEVVLSAGSQRRAYAKTLLDMATARSQSTRETIVGSVA